MGLLDQMLSGLGQEQTDAGTQANLIQLAIQLIGTFPGGLQGLLSKFGESGLSQQAQSWIGNGKKLSVSADQVMQVLGNAELETMAKKLGVNQEQVANGLADLLPQLVHDLAGDTP